MAITNFIYLLEKLKKWVVIFLFFLTSEMKELTGINIIDDFRAKLYSKYLDVSVDMLTSIVLNIQLSFENEILLWSNGTEEKD